MKRAVLKTRSPEGAFRMTNGGMTIAMVGDC